MAKAKKQKMALGVGLGLAAAAATGAGYYFYGSNKASLHRKHAMKWAEDLQSDVMKSAKKLKKLDQKAYAAIVDEAMKAYKTVKSISPSDLRNATDELKQNWHHVEKELTRTAKIGGVKATKSVKKVIRKTKKEVVGIVKKATKKAKTTVKKVSAKKSIKTKKKS